MSVSSEKTVSFTVCLMRHPHVLDADGLCYGRLDLSLAEGWKDRVTCWAQSLSDVACRTLYSSPSRRCLEVAEHLARRDFLDLVVDDRLLELDFGVWEGRPWNTIARFELDRWAVDVAGFAPPGGESGQALLARVRHFWEERTSRQTTFCVISHGGPLRILRALASGDVPDLLAPSMAQGTLERFLIRG